jgi:hypothetical protein
VQAGAVHGAARVDLARLAREPHPGPVGPEAPHRRPGDDLASLFPHEFGEGLAHGHVVDDARLRHVQRGDTHGLGLQLAQPLRSDALADDPVGQRALVDALEHRPLALADGHHHLAAGLEGQAVLAAEPLEEALPAATEGGLRGAGLVVDPGMDHAGVVTRLVAEEAVFLLEDDGAGSREAEAEAPGRGEAHDPAADHREVSAPHASFGTATSAGPGSGPRCRGG